MSGGRLGHLAAAVAALSLALAPTAHGQRAAGLRPDPATDEGGLWEAADKAELQAKVSGDLEDDEGLNAYIRGVACKVAESYCPDIRLYVMDRPFLNATMSPNGYTEVWSGLLLRATNEAELAFVLGHEVTHFAENHTIESWRALKSRQNAVLAVSIGLAVVGAAAAANSGGMNAGSSISDVTRGLSDVIYLGSIAAYYRFSRENEFDADLGGLRRLKAAGYTASAAASMWKNQIAETEASDFERVRKSGAHGSIFGSHPVTAERIAAIEKAIAAAPTTDAGGALGREAYRAAIRPHLGKWLRDELRRRDYGQSLHLINRLAATGDDLGVLEFYRGEAYRLRAGDGDLARARDAYLASAAQADAPVETWRELGDIRVKQNDKDGARAAYESYLAKAPQAEDAWLVRDALNSLN
jgi:predicted Zn-dependent protease